MLQGRPDELTDNRGHGERGGCVGKSRRDWLRLGTEPEVLSLAVPKHEAGRNGQAAEEPKEPDRRAAAQQVAAIANAVERARSQIGSVSDQAEAGEKSKQERRGQSRADDAGP